MKRNRSILFRALAVLAAISASATIASAQKKGGGGAKPPPDPAIVYVCYEMPTGVGLYVMNADGSNARNLGFAAESGHRTVKACFSPAGDRIAFNGLVGGVAGIYTVGVDGTGLQRVTELSSGTEYGLCGLSWSPAAAPDGSEKIAYIDWGNPRSLWLINPDGTGRVRLVEGFYDRFDPEGVTWSPDATRIAVGDGHTLRIYTLTCSDSGTLVIGGETAIVLPTERVDRPSWSPQPQTNLIAYSSWDGTSAYAAGDLFVADITDPQNPIVENVTNTPGVDEIYPSWSPDMTQLIFERRANKVGVARLNLDGTGWTLLRSGGLYPDRRRFDPPPQP